MIPNPIPRVLSSMRTNRVRALLMGGQACVLYGAAEFSRDIDFAIVASAANARALGAALAELRADVIAVPPFELAHLRRGHAVHFRCGILEAAGFRIDVMSKMRGVAAFSKLWARRTTVTVARGVAFDLLSLPDLVQAKKTQRDKDWPMIRRLVEAHYFEHRAQAKRPHVDFWLRELRTPELLVARAAAKPAACRRLARERKLLTLAARGDHQALSEALDHEERAEREKDRLYWLPLRQELERMRHAR